MASTAGILVGIFIAPAARAPMVELQEARLVAGRGIEGDRYFFGQGTFSRWPGSGRAITLFAEESMEAVLSGTGLDLAAGRHRRNLVTRGVALADLVGVRFRIGDVLLRGERPCLPCRHLEKLTKPGVYEALKHRDGLRAEILEEGIIRVGMVVRSFQLRMV